jgi:hypothetical protein
MTRNRALYISQPNNAEPAPREAQYLEPKLTPGRTD